MIKIPTGGYSHPLGPKVERPPIPVGYIELEKAVEMLGQVMFSDEWTGEERGFFGTGSFFQKCRSKVESETERAFSDAVLMTRCELECELYGGDPKQRYRLRTTPQNDDEPFMPMGDLPPLSPEAMKEIENRFAEEISLAKAVKKRREKVEDKFLQELLWSGSLKAHYVAVNGKITALESHIWGSEDGKRTFERGWVELDKGGGWTTVCPILLNSNDFEGHLSSAPVTKQRTSVATDEENASAAPRFSRAAVRTWYKAYVERLSSKDKKSSRDEDLAAAHEHFDVKIQRDFMRDLRRKLAPEDWTAKGSPKRNQ